MVLTSVLSTLKCRISGYQNVQHKANSRRHSGSTSSECNAVMDILVATRRALPSAAF